MGAIKAKKSSKAKKGVVGKAVSAISSLAGKSGSGGGRRRHGPTYWQNKVLVEKLKKKYARLKYGGR